MTYFYLLCQFNANLECVLESFRPNENLPPSTTSDAKLDASLTGPFALVRARCPNCHKLYSVEAAQITVPEPRFECVSCYARFAFHFPLADGEVFAPTYLLEEKVEPSAVEANEVVSVETHQPAVAQASVEPRPAPAPTKAPFSKPVNQLSFKGEIAKTESEKLVNEIKFGGTPDLVAAWKTVAANYESEEGHNKFIFACFEANCLTYASHKYAHILNTRPDDEMAKRMRKRIVALASTKSVASRKQEPMFRVPRLNSLVILMGATVMFIGFLVPSLRNMVGFGASMIALAIGLRIVLK